MPDSASPGIRTIRPADSGDRDFILELAERFATVPLPDGREAASVLDGVLRDIAHHLDAGSPDSRFFVLEQPPGQRAGFLHLQLAHDFFTGGRNCHVSDLAIAIGHEGRGHARALLAFAEAYAREHGCERLTLSVFPGNVRARALYESHGFETDVIRMARPL
jgi:ribosomal protein S18 acetylase RimI-like enzyme